MIPIAAVAGRTIEPTAVWGVRTRPQVGARGGRRRCPSLRTGAACARRARPRPPRPPQAPSTSGTRREVGRRPTLLRRACAAAYHARARSPSPLSIPLAAARERQSAITFREELFGL